MYGPAISFPCSEAYLRMWNKCAIITCKILFLLWNQALQRLKDERDEAIQQTEQLQKDLVCTHSILQPALYI